MDQRKNEQRDKPIEQLIFIPLKEENPKKMIQIGSQLSDPEWQQLINLFKINIDIFAWSAIDMPDIPPEVIIHRLHIDPKVKPVRQKKKSFAPERQKIIDEEVNKLLVADFIRKATYLD